MRYYKPNNTTLLYLNSSYNCIKASSITLGIQYAGTGYTSAPTINFTSALGDMGSGASATCTLATTAINAITVSNNGGNYNTLPTISLSGGGNPGVITGYSALSGGSGYALPPTLSVTGGNGSNFAGTTTLTATTVSSTFTITSGGQNYAVGDALNFNYTETGGGSGVIATVATVGYVSGSSNAITGITLTNAGSGFTLKPPTISGITSTLGSGAVIAASLTATSVGSIVITNGGIAYTAAPTFVFTPVSGGTGASATATINLGNPAVLTPSFLKTYSYSWFVPDVVINDLAKLSAVNIIATGYNLTTPYTYRINNVQYDSRDSFFSDYGQPILSVAQNTNICSYGSLGDGTFSIILTPQTIKQISISVDDSITTKGSGQSSSIAFVIALEIDEYNPEYEQTSDPYAEGSSRLKLHY